MTSRDNQPHSDDEVYCGKFRASEHFKEDPDIMLKRNNIAAPEIISKAVSNTTLTPDEPNLFANEDVSNSCNKLELLKNAPKTDKKNKGDNCKDADTEMEIMSAQGSRAKLALKLKPTDVVTPLIKVQKAKENVATSSLGLQSKQSLQKSQLNPSVKPSTSLKRSPSKNLAFENIASPVAYYIKKSPQIPCIQNVHPKNPLPGPPSPKLVKPTGSKTCNKEDFHLPNVAYKSAKETRVIDVTSAPKMPQSPWAQKLTKSIPRPAVIKHIHRVESTNKHSQREPEDSFGDLPQHQADISVCTKKAAL